MSIVTKIFVVLVTIFAVVHVSLVIAYVNNTAAIKGALEDATQEVAAARTQARLIEAEMAATQDNVADTVAEAAQGRQQLRNEIDELTTELAGKDQQIAELKSDLATTRAQISTLAAGDEQTARIIQMLESELSQKRDALIKADKQNIELTDQNQELAVDIDTMREQVRLLQEKLAGARQQLVEMEQRQQRVVTAAGDQARPVPAIKPIRGKITNVQQVDGETFVAVNVGSNDQVAEGMMFIIHRGDDYIGSLEITNVDLNASAGRVTLARSEVEPELKVMASDF